MSIRHTTIFLVITAGFLLAAQSWAQRGGRLAPPSALECDRNELTSFAGVLAGFDAKNPIHQVTLETEWGSRESFELDTSDDAPDYLLHGQPAEETDWRPLLADAKESGTDLHLIAWVCSCPQRVVIDWRPGPSGTRHP